MSPFTCFSWGKIWFKDFAPYKRIGISQPYLILVHHRTTGGGVLFSSRCTFFHKKRNKDCFQQSLLREICTSLVMKVCQIHQTKHQLRQKNTNYGKKNTKYAKKHQICKKTPNMQKKHQICQFSFTLFCREQIFVPNLRTLLVYFLQA